MSNFMENWALHFDLQLLMVHSGLLLVSLAIVGVVWPFWVCLIRPWRQKRQQIRRAEELVEVEVMLHAMTSTPKPGWSKRSFAPSSLTTAFPGKIARYALIEALGESGTLLAKPEWFGVWDYGVRIGDLRTMRSVMGRALTIAFSAISARASWSVLAEPGKQEPFLVFLSLKPTEGRELKDKCLPVLRINVIRKSELLMLSDESFQQSIVESAEAGERNLQFWEDDQVLCTLFFACDLVANEVGDWREWFRELKLPIDQN